MARAEQPRPPPSSHVPQAAAQALSSGDVFQGILGQSGAVEILRASLRGGRVAHGYLLTGPSGVGKETLARRLAAALLCSGRRPEQPADQVCGSCPSCTRVERGTHPDVHLVLPEAEGVRRGLLEWSEDRKPSPEIRVEQIRGLREEMRMTAFEGGWRVAILPHADRLRVEAANALLKTLEEPLPNSLLVLCAPDQGSVLETLKSRCQRIQLGPIPHAAIQAFLIKRGMDPALAEAVTLASRGSLGAALGDDPEQAAASLAAAREWLVALQSASPAALVERAEQLERDREGLDGLIRVLASCAREQAEQLLGKAGAEGRQAEQARRLTRWAEDALQLRQDVARPGANVRLALERFMLGAER